jgi:hypothetical protein
MTARGPTERRGAGFSIECEHAGNKSLSNLDVGLDNVADKPLIKNDSSKCMVAREDSNLQPSGYERISGDCQKKRLLAASSLIRTPDIEPAV